MIKPDAVHRLALRFASDDPSELAAALRKRTTFQGDLGWLEQLLDAAERLPVQSVPTRLSGVLHNMMPPAADLRTELAASIHDSRHDSVLVGARSDQDSTDQPNLDGWTAACSAASADVLLDGDPISDDSTDISGHILVRSNEPRPFTITATGPESVSVRSNHFGLFHLGPVSNGSYEMRARCADYEVRWDIEVGP